MEAIAHRERSILIFWLHAYCQVAQASKSAVVPFARLAQFVRRHEREIRWCGGSGKSWGRKLVADSGLFHAEDGEHVAVAADYRNDLSSICEKAVGYWRFLRDLHRRRSQKGLPGVLQQAALLWRHHLFFEFHEILEDVWMDWRGPERRFLQGLIQLGVAFYHVQKNNYRGAMSMFRNGAVKVAPHVPRYCGVELKTLLEEIEKCRASLERLGPGHCHEFDWSAVPPLRVGSATEPQRPLRWRSYRLYWRRL